MTYCYVKDEEGFVVKKLKSKILPNEVEISKEEYEEISGEKYYREKFSHGGKRSGAGRKPITGKVLKFQMRVSEKEKEFINYARSHNLDFEQLMQG